MPGLTQPPQVRVEPPLDRPSPAPAPPAASAPAPVVEQPPVLTRAHEAELPLARELAEAVLQRQIPALVQRQQDDASRPLTDVQVAKAISFYKRQPATYTFTIRLQIQDALGMEPTPGFDEATVQAVAVWQRENGGTPPEQQIPGVVAPPPLAVDGMAGPRTLPRMFAHGLNVKAEGLKFGQEAQTGVIDAWHSLSPEGRATKLVTLVNRHLEAAKVPPVTPDAKKTGLFAGRFEYTTWHMEIGLPALAQPKPDVKDARDLIATVYHEARHAEQWFRMAQMRAGQIRKRVPTISDARLAALIAAEMTIRPDIAAKAVKKPGIQPGSMQALIAQGWYDSWYGAGRDHNLQVHAEAEAALDACAGAEKREKASSTPATKAALERAKVRLRKAVAAVKDLPEENDAHTTESMAGPGVTSGAPDPPALTPVDPALPGIQADLEQLVGAAPAQ